MSTAIKLNLVNKSNDQNNSQIVIFSKNVAVNFDETATAWQVIENLGQGAHHPFSYSLQYDVSASDSYGNFMPLLRANTGDLFHVTKNTSGDVLTYAGPASAPQEIQIRNDLNSGAINAFIYNEGKIFSQKTSIAPGQMAVFEFKPTIWIGVVSQIEEGEVMNSAIMSDINTELGLLGISSADIIMTGGGVGPSAQPFTFTLENVKYM